MAKKYYGVAGENGYGVFNDYDKVLEIRGKIKKYKIKGFNWWEEAKQEGIEQVVKALIETCQDFEMGKQETLSRIVEKLSVSEKKSAGVYNEALEVGKWAA